MLKFTDIGQQNPPKREIDLRKEDFKEIYDEFINEKTLLIANELSDAFLLTI